MTYVNEPQELEPRHVRLESQWTTITDGPMHSRSSKSPGCMSTRVVVLVHGLVISSRYMVPAAERLAPFCEVHAVDLPGYGESYKPSHVLSLPELADALAEWMHTRNISKADFVANSFGCQILAEFVLRHPSRTGRLVFQGPTIDRTARTLWRQIVRSIRNSPREPRSLGWISLLDYKSAGLRRAWATIKLALEDRIEDKLPHIRVPTLVVRGEKDPIVPQSWAEELTGLLQKGELCVIPGAAHTLNYSAPAEFVAVIRRFLNL